MADTKQKVYLFNEIPDPGNAPAGSLSGSNAGKSELYKQWSVGASQVSSSLMEFQAAVSESIEVMLATQSFTYYGYIPSTSLHLGNRTPMFMTYFNETSYVEAIFAMPVPVSGNVNRPMVTYSITTGQNLNSVQKTIVSSQSAWNTESGHWITGSGLANNTLGSANLLIFACHNDAYPSCSMLTYSVRYYTYIG